jgi:uncharacterized protein (DUF1501 family)
MTISRRSFLELSGYASAFGAVGSVSLPDSLLGPANLDRPTVKKNKTLVVLFLRGGADCLNLVTPYGDKAYYEYRRSIALPPPKSEAPANTRLLDLDGFFGLHPRLGDLLPFWKSKDLAVVHAVGNPKNNRSHFVQQDIWETADPEADVRSEGWLNRHLQTCDGDGPLRAVSVGGRLPRALRGKGSAVAIRSVADLAYQNRYGDADKIADALEGLYGEKAPKNAKAGTVVQAAGRDTMSGLRALEDIGRTKYKPDAKAKYPANNRVATALSNVAQLIKANVGLEIAEVDYGGWDTHRNQGAQSAGAFGTLAGNVGGAIAAFARDLGDRMEDVLLVTMTEFGRTARENGTAGTDHGHGTAMFVLGGGVRAPHSGGKVLGSWPGLAQEKLNRKRDLQVTTDFRDVYAELLREHLGNRAVGKVLAGHKPRRVGLLSGTI